ncbi:PREDICTED: uncharacterized protein LOC105363984 [Ceratosolen solmsi marchali]|uniref:Uncharacterized protein LOC105363984 n=1 Tax=Ceratosolen solmsi marchali TaxID=326594 RepID=A0AAJ7DXK7_9HYME|nr:PREDICTED: uncharacterized protein LOC105363984 [Ceratosolen solmsi marchali]
MVKESQDELIKLKLVIEEIKNKRNEELDREMNSYKTRLRRLRDDIVEKENNLNNQLEAHEAVLEKLMQVNVEQEDILREYCKEAERKCLVARDVYDRDLSKLNELKETLEMQLSATSNHYNSLKNECDEQNTLFMKLKKEREFAMMQAFAQRMANFEKNRAARIIQRTWRAYYERKLSRKKKRSRKKR